MPVIIMRIKAIVRRVCPRRVAFLTRCSGLRVTGQRAMALTLME